MTADAVLVRHARGGDRDAFAELVARHHATLLTCCRRMVGDRAHDAAQDAVLTAMLSLDRLRDAEKFGSWLVGIGLNACRAQLRESDPVTRGDRRARDDRAPEPAEIVADRELSSLVRGAIAQLPRGQ